MPLGVFLLGEGSRLSLLEAEEVFVERELPDEAAVLEDVEELLADEERLWEDEEGVNFCSLRFSFVAG